MQTRYDADKRDRMYRFYVTDALKAIGQLDRRYYDLIQDGVEETRTPEEIIDHVKSGLRNLSKEKV